MRLLNICGKEGPAKREDALSPGGRCGRSPHSMRLLNICGKEGPAKREDALSPGRRCGRSPHSMRLLNICGKEGPAKREDALSPGRRCGLQNFNFHRRIKDSKGKRYLKNQNKRHSDNKFAVPCLMTKGIHANEGAEAPPNDSNDKKGGFRNPEGPFFCFVFVNAHEGKADEIY